MTIWVIKQKLYKFIQKVIKKFNLYLNFTVEWEKFFLNKKKLGAALRKTKSHLTHCNNVTKSVPVKDEFTIFQNPLSQTSIICNSVIASPAHHVSVMFAPHCRPLLIMHLNKHVHFMPRWGKLFVSRAAL